MKWLIWIKCLVAAPALLPFQVSDRMEESDRIKLLAHYSINQSINQSIMQTLYISLTINVCLKSYKIT